MTGPLLVFGGPYSNLQALQAMRQIAEQHNILPEQCICTGDIVAYCAQARETVAAIRDWGVHCLMGNCEESFANNELDCGCGFEEGTSCDLLSVQWFNYANQHLALSERNWFAQLPRNIRFTYNGKQCQVVHGSVSSMNEFVFASHTQSFFQEQFELSQADLILAGHSGLPFTKVLGEKCWHNAGVIGMPANDGQTTTWYSLLNIDAEGKIQITSHKLHYEHQVAYDEMQLAGLTNGYAEGLLSGVWPSMDVLPVDEQEQQQKTINEYTVSW